MTARAFLTAEWRYLVMLNYVVDPVLLKQRVPPGTELDYFGDQAFVSVVGFQFLQTKVLGWAFPFHRDFEEVNLRFYVRRRLPEGWRRGVVFIRELVPRAAIALIARGFYGEPYRALPMTHRIEHHAEQLRAEYGWRRKGAWESVWALGGGQAQEIPSGSLEEFITEHYWGYTACGADCSEYAVEHPRWRVWLAQSSGLQADVASLYGQDFAATLSGMPSSAFIADGSPVVVRRNSKLNARPSVANLPLLNV